MRDRHLAGLPFTHTHSTSCVCVCVCEFPSQLAKAQLLSKCHRRVSVSPCCAGLPHGRFAPLCGQPVPAISASITERCVNPPNTKKRGFPVLTPTQPHLSGPLCRGHPFAHPPAWLSVMLHNLMNFQSSYRIFLLLFFFLWSCTALSCMTSAFPRHCTPSTPWRFTESVSALNEGV